MGDTIQLAEAQRDQKNQRKGKHSIPELEHSSFFALECENFEYTGLVTETSRFLGLCPQTKNDKLSFPGSVLPDMG